jgi:lipid-binding SYLF domain-containing protein
MNRQRTRAWRAASNVFLALSLIGLAVPARAEDNAARARIDSAAAVMRHLMAAPDNGIPRELLEKATAIAVIPHDVRGAFFFGGSYGKGVVSQRLKNGSWGPPCYIDLTGGSFGLQFGVSSTDYVLVFTNNEGIRPLLRGKLKLGADASVAAGPVGRTAAAGTNVLLESAIYTYSRSKGVFAGVALNGAALTIDRDANREVYGRHATARDILVSDTVPITATVRPFVSTLDRYAAYSRG